MIVDHDWAVSVQAGRQGGDPGVGHLLAMLTLLTLTGTAQTGAIAAPPCCRVTSTSSFAQRTLTDRKLLAQAGHQ